MSDVDFQNRASLSQVRSNVTECSKYNWQCVEVGVTGSPSPSVVSYPYQRERRMECVDGSSDGRDDRDCVKLLKSTLLVFPVAPNGGLGRNRYKWICNSTMVCKLYCRYNLEQAKACARRLGVLEQLGQYGVVWKVRTTTSDQKCVSETVDTQIG